MGYHWIFGLLFIILIVWLIMRPHYYGYHRWGNKPPWEKNSALDILKERYAKGEISKEEFEEKKKDLM